MSVDSENLNEWRSPTDAEREEIAQSLDRSMSHLPGMAAMMRAGWFKIPNENHPNVKAVFRAHAESIMEKIDEEILAKYHE